MKISKSKRQLAQLLIEAGVKQFPEGTNWAAQDGDKDLDFFTDKPYKELSWWQGNYDTKNQISLGVKIPNWHQTMLSRDEFDQIVAETVPDADGWIEWKGGECPVGEEQLVITDWRDLLVGDEIYTLSGEVVTVTGFDLNNEEWPVLAIGKTGRDWFVGKDGFTFIRRP